jgi:hypothetical protein
MKSTSELEAMRQITEVRYQQAQQAFGVLLAEEAELRQKLARLKQQAAAADLHDAAHLQAVGADVLWQAWVGRSRAALNTELAQVLARKEYHISRVRLAFGKRHVAAQLLDAHRQSIRKKAAQAQQTLTVADVLSYSKTPQS